MPRSRECFCKGCTARLRAQRKWEEKNVERRREINQKSRQNRKLTSSDIPDEELDRRATSINLDNL